MRFRSILVVAVMLIFGSLVPSPVRANFEEQGTFVLFLGGVEAGREIFSLSKGLLTTEGTIEIGSQKLTVSTALKGQPGAWQDYKAQMLPGASYGVTFYPTKLEVQTGPIKRSYPLQKPYTVLDNNVFGHYQGFVSQLAQGEITNQVNVVVPSLLLANQNPVLQGEVTVNGTFTYELAGQSLSLVEFELSVMPGNLHIRLLVDDQGRLVFYAIPSQAVQVVREGYAGLKKVEPVSDRPKD